jgi:hypothetical protein
MVQSQPRLIRLAAVAATGASCLAAAACGPHASSGASAASTLSTAPSAGRALTFSPAARASASASVGSAATGSAAPGASASVTASGAGGSPSAGSATDPLAGLTGSQVAARALANLKAAPSLTMAGTFSQSGQGYSVNLGIEPAQGCTGTIGEGSKGSFKLIVIGKTLYFNPDDTFWKANGGADASAAIALIDGRYIKTSTSGSMGSLASLCNLSQTLGAIAVTGTLTKGAPTTHGGTLVLPLSSTDGTMDVTDKTVPEVVSMTAPKTGTLTFSPGAPVTLAAPPASEVIDGAKLGI